MHALVMKLVEGEARSHRLARGAIPLVEALPIALIQHWISEAKK